MVNTLSLVIASLMWRLYLPLSIAAVSGLSLDISKNSHHVLSRRNLIGKFTTAATASCCIVNPQSPAVAQVEELPTDLRKFTALAPLGMLSRRGKSYVDCH